MASTPRFTSTPRVGVATLTLANTARDGSGSNIVDVLTAVDAGTKVFEIVVQSTGDPADSIVTLFLWDGTTSHLFDEIDLDNPAAASTTVTGHRVSREYDNLVLPSVGATLWKLQASLTVVPTGGSLKVFALGGDLT